MFFGGGMWRVDDNEMRSYWDYSFAHTRTHTAKKYFQKNRYRCCIVYEHTVATTYHPTVNTIPLWFRIILPFLSQNNIKNSMVGPYFVFTCKSMMMFLPKHTARIVRGWRFLWPMTTGRREDMCAVLEAKGPANKQTSWEFILNIFNSLSICVFSVIVVR